MDIKPTAIYYFVYKLNLTSQNLTNEPMNYFTLTGIVTFSHDMANPLSFTV